MLIFDNSSNKILKARILLIQKVLINSLTHFIKFMKDLISINDRRLKEWLESNCSVEQIRNELMLAGFNEDEIEQTLIAYKKYQSERRQKPGFIYMSAGAFLGFLSCVLTMMDLIPLLTGFFLYGLTTIAICVVLYGCYLVFE